MEGVDPPRVVRGGWGRRVRARIFSRIFSNRGMAKELGLKKRTLRVEETRPSLLGNHRLVCPPAASTGDIPVPTSGRLLEGPASGFEGGAGLGVEDEGLDLGVADFFGHPGRCRVEGGADMRRAIGAKSSDFNGLALVGHAGYRASDDRHPYEGGVLEPTPETEPMAHNGLMVPMILGDEGVGVFEFAGPDEEALHGHLGCKKWAKCPKFVYIVRTKRWAKWLSLAQ